MKTPLTTHLIIGDNDKTTTRAIESLLPLGGKILAGDTGCKDETYKICHKYGVELVRVSLDHDYSKVRNELVSKSGTGWQFYLEPWETLISGHEEIRAIATGDPRDYRLRCIQGDVMTKQIRIWHKKTNLKFKNPFYEYLDGEGENDVDAIILVGMENRSAEAGAFIRRWKEQSPLAVEPYYYQACMLLTERKWDEFLKIAEHYLFHEKKSIMPMTTTRYYCALVQSYVKKDYNTAMRNIINCLATKPLMAEYWCLLGDVYYAMKKYETAKTMYDNALILGSRRLRTDNWPMEISKYDSYPKTMLESCAKIVGNTSLFSV